MKDERTKTAKKAKAAKKDLSASYNQYKVYQGKQYTGMTIGRSHKWHYDKGIWLDKKITPDKWLIHFETAKRRAGKAPEGSGAAVGTEYHWYILAHQMVKKLDANTYSTEMNGLKFKLAHKRRGKEKWNITDKTQRDHLIKILKGFIQELEKESPDEFAEQHENAIQTKKEIAAKKAVMKKVSKSPVRKKVRKESLVEA